MLDKNFIKTIRSPQNISALLQQHILAKCHSAENVQPALMKRQCSWETVSSNLFMSAWTSLWFHSLDIGHTLTLANLTMQLIVQCHYDEAETCCKLFLYLLTFKHEFALSAFVAFLPFSHNIWQNTQMLAEKEPQVCTLEYSYQTFFAVVERVTDFPIMAQGSHGHGTDAIKWATL